jgi:hypothetical protein
MPAQLIKSDCLAGSSFPFPMVFDKVSLPVFFECPAVTVAFYNTLLIGFPNKSPNGIAFFIRLDHYIVGSVAELSGCGGFKFFLQFFNQVIAKCHENLLNVHTNPVQQKSASLLRRFAFIQNRIRTLSCHPLCFRLYPVLQFHNPASSLLPIWWLCRPLKEC